VARLCCLIASVLALTAGLSAEARADADPASDVLLTQSVFLPLSARVSPQLANQLVAVTRKAQASGKQIRVALIASPTDLGGVPSLFGKPTDYARFLGGELQFVYTGPLLVVMPQGAALSQRGRLVANADVVHAAIETGADGLARSAIELVQALTGASAGPGPPLEGPAGGGVPAWAWAAIAGVAVFVLFMGGFAGVRLRTRARGAEQPAGDMVSDEPNPSP
jgi:hypothetical protein